MPAAASSKRKLFAFELRPLTSDGYGNTEAVAFEERFRVHGQLMPRLGGETVMASRLSGSQPATIKLRSSPQLREVTPEWRIRDVKSGAVYNIRSIANPDQRDRELEFLCDTGTGVAT